jgi:hypothetical protein
MGERRDAYRVLVGKPEGKRHLEHLGVGRDAYRVLVGKPEGKRHLEHLGVDGRIILR